LDIKWNQVAIKGGKPIGPGGRFMGPRDQDHHMGPGEHRVRQYQLTIARDQLSMKKDRVDMHVTKWAGGTSWATSRTGWTLHVTKLDRVGIDLDSDYCMGTFGWQVGLGVNACDQVGR